MKMYKELYVLIFALIAGAACEKNALAAQTDQKPALSPAVLADVKIFKDLEYDAIGERKLLLDLYLPQKVEGKLPLLVWIHGGGWHGGSKEDCFPVQNGFVQKGYAVASVEYRFSDVALFPAQIEDCKSAIRWLRADADKYNLDPNHVGAWGNSAGGHLVSLLAVTGDIKKFDTGDNLNYSSAVQAVCDYYGPIDFPSFVTTPGYERHAGPASAETALIGGQVLDNPEKAREVSVTTYISKGDAPMLIVHGDKDPTVPIAQSQMLYDALKKVDVEAAFIPIEGARHGGPEFSSPQLISQIDEFFKNHLQSNPESK